MSPSLSIRMDEVVLNEFIGSLPLPSLAFPTFKKSERKWLMRLSDSTIRDAEEFLEEGGGGVPALSEFSKDHLQGQLDTALTRFRRIVNAWVGGYRRDDRFVWIVPESIASRLETRRVNPETLKSIVCDLTNKDEELLQCDWFALWISFISVELVLEISKMQPGDQAHLLKVFGRSCRRLGLTAESKPWNPELPETVRSIPTSWLYQFDPTDRTERILIRLDRGGCLNVGHLAVAHPECWKVCRTIPAKEWRAISLGLRKKLG